MSPFDPPRNRNLPRGEPGGRYISTELSINGYEIVGEIGRGGFGVVHRAKQIGLDRDVAIKVLAAARMDDDGVRRFERECRVLGRLSDHPNIVTVHGSGFTSGGEPFIAMEYLPRGSLGDRLDHEGALPWQEAVSHIVKLGGALETAHRAGILHRDVKPENVLLSTYGEPMLADFGIARVADTTRTQAGAITTSLGHASPEVLDGRDPGAPADVYALASTLYELLSGSMAFDPGDGGVVAMVGKVLNRPVPDLRPAGIPASICDAVETGMSKSLDERPATAAGFATILVAAAKAAGHDVDPPRIGELDPEAAPLGEETPLAPSDAATRMHARSEIATAARQSAPAPSRVVKTPPVSSPEKRAEPRVSSSSGRPPWLVPAGVGIGAVALIAVLASALGGSTGTEPVDTASTDPVAGASATPSESEPPEPVLPTDVEFAQGANAGSSRVLWTHRPGVRSLAGTRPTLAQAVDGRLVLGSRNGIDVLEAVGGRLLWSAPVDLPEDPHPIVLLPGRSAILVDAGTQWLAFDILSGEELFRADMEFGTIAQGVLLVASRDSVAVVDHLTGEDVWRVTTASAPTLPPQPALKTSIVWFEGEQIVGVNAETGEDVFRLAAEGRLGPAAPVPETQILLTAIGEGDQLRLAALDADSGALVRIWSTADDAERTGRADVDRASMGANDEYMLLYDGSHVNSLSYVGRGENRDQRHIWDATVSDEQPFIALTPAGVVVVESTPTPTMTVRDPASGDVVCTSGIPEHDVSPAVWGERRLHVTGADGQLTALDLRTCEKKWQWTGPQDAKPGFPFLIDLDIGFVVDTTGAAHGLRLWDVDVP